MTVDRGHPVLHQVASQAADDAANEHDERNPVMVKANFLGEALDGKWAVSIDLLVAGVVRAFRGVDQRLR